MGEERHEEQNKKRIVTVGAEKRKARRHPFQSSRELLSLRGIRREVWLRRE